MTKWQQFKEHMSQQGQSLTEAALFLPILIFLIAGTVEVSNLLVVQNKLTTAARSAAGFGAANYDPADWPGTADAMGVVALNTVTETLVLDSQLWDIWSVNARTNADGSAFAVFTATHVFGDNVIVSAEEWAAVQTEVQAEMLGELQSTGGTTANDLPVVASVTYFAADTLLGLPIWQWTGLQTLRGLTVMRVGEREAYAGCPLLPITVRLNQYSAYPSNWPAGLQLNPGQYPGDPVELFPATSNPNGGFQYPNPDPRYQNIADAPALRTSTYVNNWPGVPLADAQPGYIYLARQEGPPNGNFGWLSWDGDGSTPTLVDSLTFPGNFLEKYPGSDADMGTTNNAPFGDTGNQNGILEFPNDQGKYEWLEGVDGNVTAVADIIRDYIDKQTPLSLIYFDENNGESGANANYRVRGFLVVKFIGYSFQGSNPDKWIMFEFVNWGSECQ
jgi:hypothetical protein